MTYAASEIVEIAIQIEINGYDFYKKAAAYVKSRKVKETFEYLAGEEERHGKIFKEILGRVQKYEPKEAFPEEYFAHIRSLAENKIFTQKNKGKETADKVKDQKEAIDLGIRAEKYSIGFYEAMKGLVPENDKKIISEIIKEEEKHLNALKEY